MDYKILIIVDTNIINSNSYGGSPFGSEYIHIKDFIKEYNLENNVHIAIPQVVIDEISSHTQNRYNEDIKKIREISEKINTCPKHKIQIEIDKNFDATKRLRTLVEEEKRNYSNFHILGFSENTKVPNILYKDALLKKKVFNEHSARKFMDALVIELISDSELIQDFDGIYILTQNGEDFSAYIKRLKRTLGKNFEVVIGTDILEIKLFDIFQLEDYKLMKFLEGEYFKDATFEDIVNLFQLENINKDDMKYHIENISERANVAGEENYFNAKISLTLQSKPGFNKDVFIEIDRMNNILNIDDYDRA